MGKRFDESTFVFVFGHPGTRPCRDDASLVAAIRILLARGATVKVICQHHSELVTELRELGVDVAQYRLNQWNILRTRSRLRKYLRRYHAAVAHSTGRWGNILLAAAARPLPGVSVVMSFWCGGREGPGRGQELARRIELRGAVAVADLVITESEGRAQRLVAAGYPERAVLRYSGQLDADGLVDRYREFLRR